MVRLPCCCSSLFMPSTIHHIPLQKCCTMHHIPLQKWCRSAVMDTCSRHQCDSSIAGCSEKIKGPATCALTCSGGELAADCAVHQWCSTARSAHLTWKNHKLPVCSRNDSPAAPTPQGYAQDEPTQRHPAARVSGSCSRQKYIQQRYLCVSAGSFSVQSKTSLP